MTKIIEKEKQRIRKVAHLLYDGAKRVRILRSIDWPASVKQGFFAKGAKELPEISYPGFDAKPTIDIIREARRMIIPISTIDLWLERQSISIETGARMLAGVGTPVFFEHSRQVYGEPTDPLRFIPATPLELAQSVQDVIDQLARIDLGVAPSAHLSADDVAKEIQKAVSLHFAEDAPKVVLVDTLSANALATADRIRIRRDARFTDRDAAQLLNHEAYIHVATSLDHWRGALYEGRRLYLRPVASEHCNPGNFICRTIRLFAPIILWKAGTSGHSSTVRVGLHGTLPACTLPAAMGE
jgi:hypothetical protein